MNHGLNSMFPSANPLFSVGRAASNFWSSPFVQNIGIFGTHNPATASPRMQPQMRSMESNMPSNMPSSMQSNMQSNMPSSMQSNMQSQMQSQMQTDQQQPTQYQPLNQQMP